MEGQDEELREKMKWMAKKKMYEKAAEKMEKKAEELETPVKTDKETEINDAAESPKSQEKKKRWRFIIERGEQAP